MPHGSIRKSTMKRSLSLLLVLAMFVSLVTIPSFAANLDPERDYFSGYGGNSLNIKQGTPTIDGLVDEEYLSSASIISNGTFLEDDVTHIPVNSPNVIDADFVTYILADTNHLYFVAIVRDHDVADGDLVSFFSKFGEEFATAGVDVKTGKVTYDAGTVLKRARAAVTETSYGYIVELEMTLNSNRLLVTGSTFGYHTLLDDYNSNGEVDKQIAGHFFNDIYTVSIPNPTPVVSSFTGKGRPDDPYILSSYDELDLLKEFIVSGSTNQYGKKYENCAYYLTADIDFRGDEWVPFSLNAPFYGNGHTISNFKVVKATTNPQGGYYAGFFGNLSSGAEIYNLNLKDFSVELSTAFGAIGNIGGFSGTGGGLIEACSVTNVSINVYGRSQHGIQVGAFVGYGGHNINNCYVDGATVVLHDGDAEKLRAGAFMCSGDNNLSITNSYVASTTVSGYNAAGEIFPEISSPTNCFYYNVTMNGSTQTSAGYVNTAAYIYNTLGWSKTVWNAVDGALPTLIPVVYKFVTFAGGNGTSASPYLIEDADQLKLMNKLVSTNDSSAATASYKLIADIDLNGDSWTPVGGAKETFNGNFDGDGHSITNFKIINSPHDFYTGFFTIIGATAEICNLRLANFTVEDKTGRPVNWVGGIVGKNDGMIRNCMVQSASILAAAPPEGQNVTGNIAGGIAGFNSNTITNCLVDSTTVALDVVNFQGLGAISGAYQAGSAIQYCMASNITFVSPTFDDSFFSILGGDVPADGQGYEVSDNTYYNISYGSVVGETADGFENSGSYIYDVVFMEPEFWGIGKKMPYLLSFGDIVPTKDDKPSAKAPFTVKIDGPNEAKKGDKVSYTFTVSDLTNISALLSAEYTIKYDNKVLTYVDYAYTAPNDWSVFLTEGDGSLSAYFSDDMMLSPSAELVLTVNFTVKSDTEAASTTISVEGVAGTDDSTNYVDGDGSTLAVAITAGTVEPVRGDVNGNGVLDSNDLALIRSMIIGATDEVEIADMNGNGKIDSNDYILVRKAILNAA